MDQFITQLFNGITLGAIYALIALGYTMVYGIIKLINFAHGEIFMVGAFAGLVAASTLSSNFVVAIGVAMVVSAVLGMLIERLAYKPLRNSSRITALISAIGMSILISNAAAVINGPQREVYPDFFEGIGSVGILGTDVSLVQIMLISISVILMLLLTYIVNHTKLGTAMRASSQNKMAASLMGINVNNIISFTFALGSALAAAGGVIYGTYYHVVYPTVGLMVGLKAFVAAVLGGIGSIPGAMIGGLCLGLAEIFGVAFLNPSYRDVIAFGMLILILALKPTGIMGKMRQEKV